MIGHSADSVKNFYMAEEVLIEFKVNTKELQSAQAQLTKAGKVDSTQLDNFNKKISVTNKEAQGLVKEFSAVKSAAQQLGKSAEQAFQEGVNDALKEAGVSLEDFEDALRGANEPAKSLRAELKELKLALAEAKLNGQDFGEEFDSMRARAGALQDAIADANAEIKNVASDTRNIDNVVGSVAALSGGFAAAQGAAALFGDESEDLQMVLVKINAAMAISQGVQQVSNALQKEGALVKLADVVATNAQIATQKIYAAVTGKSTAATKAFKVALASTGIGLLVVGVLALVSALTDSNDELERTNQLLEDQESTLNRMQGLINRRVSLQEQLAKEAGKSESEILKIRRAGILLEQRAIDASNERLEAQKREVLANVRSISDLKEAGKALEELDKRIAENIDSRIELSNQVQITSSQIRDAAKQEAEEAKKAAEEEAKRRKELADKRLADLKEARLRNLNDELAALELQLLKVEKNTQAEIDIRKKLIEQKARIELEADKLTANQKKLIQEQALQEQIDLQNEFNTRVNNNALEAQIKENEAALAGIELTEQERLRIKIENINAAAQIELNAADLTAQQIAAIKAKRDAEVREAQNENIRINLQRELEAEALKNERIISGLNKVAADSEKSANERIAAVQALSSIEIGALEKQLLANEELKQSDEDRLRNRQNILQQIANAEAETADQIVDINKEATDKLKAEAEARRDLVLDVMGQLAQTVAFFNQQQSEVEAQRLNEQKNEIDALLESGAITEKEAEKRRKKLEVEEKKARQRAAERQKQEAVFTSLLAIPQAYLSGLKTGGLPLAILYAALAAAQAGAIAARPVPKFFRGKKDTYEGLGEVADMGPELVQRKSGFELYTKPTITHLGRYDKVHTASETRKIFERTDMKVSKDENGYKFDYKKLAKMMPKSKDVSINIDKGFIEESVNNGLMKNRYFDNRYRFN